MSTNGYLVHLKTTLVEACKQVFDATFPEVDFRDLHVSIEYPVDEQNYPGIWVAYSDTQPLRIAGIDHKEYTEAGVDGTVQAFTRWRFAGYASFTLVALSSLERDRLFDAMVRVLALHREDDSVSAFRQYIENNEFVAVNFDFDEVEVVGNSVTPGTPWGSDEFIYEVTVNMEAIGEFISDNATGDLVPLRAIYLTGRPVLAAFDDETMEYPDEVAFPLGPNDTKIAVPPETGDGWL